VAKESRCLPVLGERVRLAAAPVEREHQQTPKLLAKRMLPDERNELRQHLVVQSELKLHRDPLLQADETELLEPARLRHRKRLVREVVEGGAAPQCKSAAKQRRRQSGVPAGERLATLGELLLEAARVELALVDLQQ